MVPVRLRPIILKAMRAVERVEASLPNQKKELIQLRKAMRAVGWVEGSVFKKNKSEKNNNGA